METTQTYKNYWMAKKIVAYPLRVRLINNMKVNCWFSQTVDHWFTLMNESQKIIHSNRSHAQRTMILRLQRNNKKF
jgi:hypothetical protein